MIDYAENLCEAMKIIFEKQIKQLSFDITIDATVVDATNAKNGMYVVSHDGATFTAYSTDTSFKEKDVVMVTVPQGNYDNQKMIIGKQVDKDKEEKPITYQSPFSQITNLSGNLVYGNIEEKGLLANGGVGKQDAGEREAAQKILIREFISDNTSDLNNDQSILSKEYQTNGYTRLGLRADFSTWLNEFNVVSGNYGLILTLKFKNPDAANTNESIITAIYTFDSSEFFGDIYNFETYYNQEAIFDISDYSNYPIQSIKLEAYQKDNFKVSDGSYLSYKNEIFDNSFKPSDNIFIKDPFICLGTAVGEFKKDTANIMTTSTSIYNNNDNSNDDIKDLKLKWTHQDSNSQDIYVVQNDSIPTNYEIRWYRFELGASSPDKFMDAHWIRFYGCKPEADEHGDYCLTQEEINNNENFQDIATNKINVNFQPNRNNQTEQIRVVILRKDENNNELLVVQTPIIIFNNNQQILPDIKYIDANALGIQFNDTEKGKYYYYDKTGKKMSSKEKNPKHILKAVFDNNTNLENKGDLTNQTYTSIKWIFPKNNTMIIPLDPGGKNILESQSGQPIENNISPNYTVNINENNYEILFENENAKSILETMTYKIDDNFSFNKSRNTVYLEVVINGQTYISSATMFFGTAGTSGSEYTIIVEWSVGIPVFDINKDNETLTGTVKLLDLNFEEVVLNSNAIYSYNLKYSLSENSNIGLICQSENNSPNQSIFTISKTNNIDMNDLYILEIKLTNFGNYDLITNYPIALKNTIKDENEEELVKINSITGATMVRYASDGTITPDDNNPYSISFQTKENNNFVLANSKYEGFWQIIPAKNNDNKNFLPELVDIDNTVEAFILELSKISYPNSDSETTLLDVLLYIIPKENAGYSNNNRLNSLISSINNINKPYTSPPFEEGQQKETNDNFKNFLSKIEKRQLNNLFSTLEKKFGKDYFFTPFLSKKINPILSPPSVYLKDTPLYGVQYVYSPDGISNQILYTQPIYVYQDNYPSTTINQWNGKEMIFNEEEGTFVANGFSAGKKEIDDNTFSGVMIGDWSRTLTDSSISNTTGIYGFNHGAMSYAFKDDGTAFIGKDGRGRIEFDGNNGIIKSAGFQSASNDKPGFGTCINLESGILELYSLQETTENQINYYLKLSSIGEKQQPFIQVGRKRDEAAAIFSKQLSDYYLAYEDLKSYTQEKYNDLSFFAQSYLLLKERYPEWAWTDIDADDKNWIKTPGLLPYAYLDMKNIKNPRFDEQEKEEGFNYQKYFPELYDKNNNFGLRVESKDDVKQWYFFDFLEKKDNKSFKSLLILKEQEYFTEKYLEYISNFYKNPSYENLNIVNTFVMQYITEFDILETSEINNILNYYLEDVSNLLQNAIDKNQDMETNTKNQKLIKFMFNNSIQPLIAKDEDDIGYFLYNFKKNQNIALKHTTSSIDDIQACIQASEFFIKESDNSYTKVNNKEIYYHCIKGNEINDTNAIEASSFLINNTYKKTNDGYELITESDFKIYYIKKSQNNYIQFKNYFSFIPVDNTTNEDIVNTINRDDISPIIYFKNKNKNYFYKDKNDTYVYANFCDNNYQYFYISDKAEDYQKCQNNNFDENMEFFEIDYNSTITTWDINPYKNYLFQLQSSTKLADNNFSYTYILENFILYDDEDTSKEIIFKVGDGTQGVLDKNTFKTIQTNTPYDIFLQIDTSQSQQDNLNGTDWYIKDSYTTTIYQINDEDPEEYSEKQIKYYTSLKIVKKNLKFGKQLLNNKIESKYNILTGTAKRVLTSNNNSATSANRAVGIIESKIATLNAASSTILATIPVKKRATFRKALDAIKYYKTVSTSGTPTLKYITIIIDQPSSQLEKIKDYLKQDIANNFIFEQLQWDNDLIKIVKNGGYITSKDYRPTMISGDKTPRLPTDKQDDSSSNWRQGMKGFIIDLSNNRIVLGNNSAIEGIQTQYYPGQTNVSHRYFSISTGVRFEEDKNLNSDRLKKETEGSDKSFFIRARAGYNASTSSLRDMFYVRWNGDVYIDNKLTVKNINCTNQITSKYFKVSTGFYFGPYHIINVGQLYTYDGNHNYNSLDLYYYDSGGYEKVAFLCYEM